MKMIRIATIRTDFPTKFGLPRQSSLINTLQGIITFQREYANADALRGLEGFSHIWLLWKFQRSQWSPTVRPPRLGGNRRLGVFATRSPFRPNPIGLSCVKLEKIEFSSPEGPRIIVSGVDMMDGTPIIDIKPYLPYTDSHPEAKGDITNGMPNNTLNVVIPDDKACQLSAIQLTSLREILAEDPRPHYQDDANRVYGFCYANMEVSFRVQGTTLTVLNVSRI